MGKRFLWAVGLASALVCVGGQNSNGWPGPRPITRPPVFRPPVHQPSSVFRPPVHQPSSVFRPPVQVKSTIRNIIPHNPHTAASVFVQRRPTLDVASRRALGREIFTAIGTSWVRGTLADPVATLHDFHQHRALASQLSPRVKRALPAVESHLVDQVFLKQLEPVFKPGASRSLRTLDRNAFDQVMKLDLSPAEKTTLTNFLQSSTRVRSLGNILDALEASAAPERLTGIAGESMAPLPDGVRQAVQRVQATSRLQELARGELKQTWNVKEIQEALSTFARETSKTDVAGRLQQEVAVKAWMEGHFSEARQLLSRDGPPQQAAAMLRDMKALLLNEGRAEAAADHQPGQAGDLTGGKGTRDPPPGLGMLLPEAPAQGWRPTVQQRALEGLPSLAEVAPVHQEWKSQARKAVGAEEQAARAHHARTGEALRTHYENRFQRSLAWQLLLVQARARMGRELTPIEQLLALDRLRAGHPQDAILEGLLAEEDDELRKLLEAFEELDEDERGNLLESLWLAGSAPFMRLPVSAQLVQGLRVPEQE